LAAAAAAGSAVEGRALNHRIRLFGAGMAPAKYGDLGKKAGDILRKDFFIQHRLVLNSTLKGVEVQATLCTGGQRTSSLGLFKAWPRKGVKVKAAIAVPQTRMAYLWPELSLYAFRPYLVVKNRHVVLAARSELAHACPALCCKPRARYRDAAHAGARYVRERT
jgi:hypothetical protein